VLAALAALLYNISDLVVVLYSNHPSRLPSIDVFASKDVLFADTVRNCEDAVYNANGAFLILSCDPGRDTWNTVMVMRHHWISNVQTAFLHSMLGHLRELVGSSRDWTVLL
jgi:hypothetical protein